jgi:alpha-glucosidase
MVEGGRTVELEAPLEQIPLLVRAGSTLPMEKGKQLILHLYPPESGESEGYIYSDAGDGYGESRRDRFRLIRDQNGLELVWKQEGNYDFPYESVLLQVHGMTVKQAWVDEREVVMQGQQLQCYLFERVRLV